MAILKGPLHSIEAHGSVAKQIVFKKTNGRNVATVYSTPGSVKPFFPNSSQQEKRARYGAAVGYWQSLTSDEKAIYATRAKNENYSGWNLFLQEYMAGVFFSYYGLRIYGRYLYGKTS